LNRVVSRTSVAWVPPVNGVNALVLPAGLEIEAHRVEQLDREAPLRLDIELLAGEHVDRWSRRAQLLDDRHQLVFELAEHRGEPLDPHPGLVAFEQRVVPLFARSEAVRVGLLAAQRQQLL
jgi:hypothetical protein